jgi:IclR family pca regulon transcriptional regulator
MQAFTPEKSTLTLSEVAERTNLTRAAARRFLLTLAHLGYVGTDRKTFWLKPKVLELGQRYLGTQVSWQVAQPIVERTARSLGESCSLCILDGSDIVYLCRVAISRLVSVNLSIGSRIPAYATGLGMVLLSGKAPTDLQFFLDTLVLKPFTQHTVADKQKLKARIDRARTDGYSMVDQELEIGLLGFAVPVMGPSSVVAALGISVHSGRVARKDLLQRFLPVLRESAALIETGIQERLG